VKPPWTLHHAAAYEAQRTARTGRPFAVLRIAPAGASPEAAELAALEALVATNLRRTDVAGRVRDRELGVLLIESAGPEAVVARLRSMLVHCGVDVRIGWGAVGPLQHATWQEAWRWAGQLLVADGAVRAAA
jgi:hypothetical protein